MGTAAIVNIGTILTGRLDEPFYDGDSILMKDGNIAAMGKRADVDIDSAEVVVDANGITLSPGLIDSHCHISFGDYSFRQKTVDFLESYTHGGISSVISPSEVHTPGRPRDPVGVKALALAAQRCYANYRPGGMTVHGGSVLIEPGLVEEDFKELASHGVWLAKVGFGNFTYQRECSHIVRWAQHHGFVVMCHTGGASIPGSTPVTADDLLEMLPDVSGHVNGGPTAMSDADVERVIKQTQIALQVVQAGNLRSAILVTQMARAENQLHRLLIATDTPTGTGVMPLGMIKSVVEISSLAGLAPEQAIAAATGNHCRAYRIDEGILEVGRPANLFLMDAPLGSWNQDALHSISRGDIPGITCLFTQGELQYVTSRNTPPPTHPAKVVVDRTRRWS